MPLNFFPAVTAVHHNPLPPPDMVSSSAASSSHTQHMSGPSSTSSYGYQVNPLTTLLSTLQQQLPSPSSSCSSISSTSASPVASPLTSSHVLQQLLAGGVAGGVARTVVAPLDRVKMLMQTQHLLHKSHTPHTPLTPQLPTVRTLGLALPLPSFRPSPSDKYSTLVSSLLLIYREEGLRQLWKGNALNVLRVVPYSAIQFTSYDAYKHTIRATHTQRRLTARERLEAGALAGMTATTLTHPMDVVRLRLSVDKSLHSTRDALREVLMEGGVRALFKGYVATMLSVSPYIALNFASFDLLKQRFPIDSPATHSTHTTQSHHTFTLHPTLHTLALGAAAGLFAQSVCYPLDTIRRRQQMKGNYYTGTLDAIYRIGRVEGVRGYYRGMVPNALKVVPSNAIRFVAYEALKRHMGLDTARTGGSSSM